MRDSSQGGSQVVPVSFFETRFSLARKWFFSLLVLGLLASLAAFAAEEPDTQYLRIYNLSDQGDAFLAKGETNQAKAKYQQALNALIALKQDRPDWNKQVVTYRLNELREKLASFEKRAPAPAPAPQSQPSKPVARPQTSSSPGFKLLDAGAEPRKPLRLHPKVGDKQQTTVTIKLAADVQIAGIMQTQMTLPAIVMDMETVVTNVASNGDITYAMTITGMRASDEPGAMAGMAGEMAKGFSEVKGMTTIVTVNDRGANKSTSVAPPSGADPKMKQAMDQAMKQATDQMKSISDLSAGFPEEPVGKGARWQLAFPIKAQGINVTPTATFEMVSLEGDQYTMKVIFAAQLANQRVQLSPQANGPRLDLTRASLNATANISSDLNHMFPASGNMDGRLEVQAALIMGNQRQPASVKATLGGSLESK